MENDTDGRPSAALHYTSTSELNYKVLLIIDGEVKVLTRALFHSR